MGWASGFSAGTRLGEAILKGQQRRAYEDIQSQKAEGSQGYTTDDAAELEAAAQTGLYDIIPQYAEPTPQQRDPNRMNPVELERNMSQAPRGEFTGYKVVPKAQMFQGQPVEQPEAGLVAPSRVTDFLGQRYAGDLPEARQVGLRSRALAEATVDPMERQRLMSAATDEERKAVLAERQDKLFPLQLEAAQQGVTKSGLEISASERSARLNKLYDDGMDTIMATTYEKADDRTNAVLSLLEQTKGPEVAAQLRASYTTTELNTLSLQAKKFDEGFRQARARGVVPALEWFDEQNTSFKLERDEKNPFKIYQINEDNTKSVFADAKSERELGMIIDAKAKPGGWLELAKFEQDKATADVQQSYYKALTKNVGITDIEKKLAAYAKFLGRKPTTSEVNRLFGVEAKETGRMSDLQKANLEHYRKMTERGGPWAGRPQGELDKEAADLGIYELLKPGSKTASGLGGWNENPTGTGTAPPPKSQPQPILTTPAAMSGLVSPEQYSAGGEQQAAQAEARAQGALVRGVEASGRGREDYTLRQEAASITPAVIGQLTPRQAGEVALKYGRFLTSEQRRALNRRQ